MSVGIPAFRRQQAKPLPSMISTNTASPFESLVGSPSLDRDVLIARLKSRGVKPTAPRVALLDALTAAGRPLTIDQLYAQAANLTCDVVTVYRAINAFERAGVVYRSGYSETGAVLYSVRLGASRTYPVVQRGSSVIDSLDSESSAELELLIAKIKTRLEAKGYRTLEHVVEFFAARDAQDPVA